MPKKTKPQPAAPQHILVETRNILGSARAALNKADKLTEARRELEELLDAAETNLEVFIKANLSSMDLHAQVAMQNEMIDGARKAASRMMIEIGELQSQLDAGQPKATVPKDWCNCKTVHSWHGKGHASQCPCVVATWR